MADYSLQSPTPLSRLPGAATVTGPSAKGQIEQVTGLLKEVNQLAPHIKELIQIVRPTTAPNLPAEDPQGLRSPRPDPPQVRERVVEKIVQVEKPIAPAQAVEMFIMGLSQMEEMLGSDMPLGKVKEWTITNRKAIEMAVANRSKTPVSPLPDTSPKLPPEN